MAEMDDIYHHCYTFSSSYNKRRDMLFEQFDHLINHQLSYSIEERKVKQIHLQLRMLNYKSSNVW